MKEDSLLWFPSARRNTNLVIVRAGRGSFHPSWMDQAGEAEFDLLVAAYEDCTPNEGSSSYASILVPGAKVSGYREVFRRHPELIHSYDFIAFFDEDIRTSQHDIERLFHIGRDYRLDLFQPALSWDSYFSYAATLATDKFRLRYTNTVEMMCPVFRTDYLLRALPLFELGFETGIDLLWTRLTDAPWFRYAIVDDVVVKHTRPVGTTKTRHGFSEAETYDKQIRLVLNTFEASFHGFVSYAAIDKTGNPVLSRYLIGLYSLLLWAAWDKTPMNRKHFARFLSDYTRHCFTRPVNLHRIGPKLTPASLTGRRMAADQT